MPDLVCANPVCGRTFYRVPAKVHPDKLNYCSHACRWHHQRPDRIMLICQNPDCGQRFEVKPSRLKERNIRFCSRACRQGTYFHWRPLEERLWSKVEKTPTCWIWTGATTNGGYGVLKLPDGTRIRTHRLAYELTYGLILPGIEVCHACDTPPCCRPTHLWVGTHKDNMDDACKKGRIVNPPIAEPHLLVRGQDRTQAKLTDNDVREIRSLKGTMSQEAIARLKGVARTTIQGILENRSWIHLLPPAINTQAMMPEDDTKSQPDVS